MKHADHGDEVLIATAAPADYRPGARVWVVGTRKDPASDSAGDSADMLVLIEYEDGTSLEIPGRFILPLTR